MNDRPNTPQNRPDIHKDRPPDQVKRVIPQNKADKPPADDRRVVVVQQKPKPRRFRLILLLLLLILLLLVGGIGHYTGKFPIPFLNPPQPTPAVVASSSPTSAAEQFFVITISASGFSVDGNAVSATEAVEKAKASNKKIKLVYEADARTGAETEIENLLSAAGLHVSSTEKK